MKVILANINGIPELKVRHSIKLKKTCESLGLEHPLHANSAEELIDILSEHKEEDLLLFSNFPPSSSYPESGKSIQLVDEGDYISRSWEADYYSISQSLFVALEKRHKFKAIHFITGAPSFLLEDRHIESLFPGTHLTIIRKQNWIGKDSNYQELFRLYLEKNIKEALE